MTTFAAVLRSGGEYRPEHVQALASGVASYLPDARFVCLSDVPVPGVRTIPLGVSWPGWWAKMALFRPGQFFGRVVYIDLDTVVVGCPCKLAAYDGPFAMLSDFYYPSRPASGVMAWEADCPDSFAIWNAFRRDPGAGMRTAGGDQGFIRKVLGDGVVRLQDVVPGIVSYKVHCQDGVPEGSVLCCAHGRPKPWDAEWRLAA